MSGNVQPYNGTTYTTTSTSPTNSRGIPFLSMKQSDVDLNNAPINPLPTGTEIYFNIAMDADYDGILGVAPSAVKTLPNLSASPFNSTAQAGGGTTTAGVAVWANCNGNNTSSPNAGFYPHTY